MRKLIILRGASGCGKSTFIKDNDLENYTLSTDAIRLMYASPELGIDYKENIPQFYNKKVWDMLYYLLEERMKKGELTFIDATHIYADESFPTYKKLADELAGIEYSTQNIEELEKSLKEQHEVLLQKASVITEKRQDYAKVLSVYIQERLEKLELPKARFEISVTPKELTSDGADNVEFLISTNVSEDLKPLAKVASGGEISRVMLAIKSIFAQSDDIDTVIFDEIDTGISGKASQSVADEIKDLSKYHQIILITHQPIIASKADKHFYVRKSQSDETKVEVYVLTGENRIKALAELAGGEINEQSVEFAKSLIEA